MHPAPTYSPLTTPRDTPRRVCGAPQHRAVVRGEFAAWPWEGRTNSPRYSHEHVPNTRTKLPCSPYHKELVVNSPQNSPRPAASEDDLSYLSELCIRRPSTDPSATAFESMPVGPQGAYSESRGAISTSREASVEVTNETGEMRALRRENEMLKSKLEQLSKNESSGRPAAVPQLNMQAMNNQASATAPTRPSVSSAAAYSSSPADSVSPRSARVHEEAEQAKAGPKGLTVNQHLQDLEGEPRLKGAAARAARLKRYTFKGRRSSLATGSDGRPIRASEAPQGTGAPLLASINSRFSESETKAEPAVTRSGVAISGTIKDDEISSRTEGKAQPAHAGPHPYDPALAPKRTPRDTPYSPAPVISRMDKMYDDYVATASAAGRAAKPRENVLRAQPALANEMEPHARASNPASRLHGHSPITAAVSRDDEHLKGAAARAIRTRVARSAAERDTHKKQIKRRIAHEYGDDLYANVDY